MTVIKIGDKLLVESCRLLVPEGDEARIEFSLPESDLPLSVTVKFVTEESEDSKGSITVKGKAQDAVITFRNWNSVFGATMQKQLSFAESQDGDEVYFIASAKKAGKVYCLDIQFLLKYAEVSAEEIAIDSSEVPAHE